MKGTGSHLPSGRRKGGRLVYRKGKIMVARESVPMKSSMNKYFILRFKNFGG